MANKVVSEKAVKKTTPVKKTVVEKKEATVKVVKKVTMRTRSGLHILNPRKVKSTEKGSSVKVSVVGVDGSSKGSMNLPVEIFGQVPNKTLIAQAVRIYLANQRQGTASVKTRSEVVGTTKKIYRQKGTGRARHGAAKAPIFVGGGVAMGPKPHDFSLKFPKKMKKLALISALSEKAQGGTVTVVEGDFSGKTKEVSSLIKAMSFTKKSKADKVLFIVDDSKIASQAARNIDGLVVESATTVSTYGVVINKNIVFMKNAIEVLAKRFNEK